ncbi:MAG: hypothetical protein CTY39_12300 [Hyphomicrobium sp.]|nr:MAG: hypothetical protein CTY39_12300 [Hyphomicrobium sp.]
MAIIKEDADELLCLGGHCQRALATIIDLNKCSRLSKQLVSIALLWLRNFSINHFEGYAGGLPEVI